MFYILLTYLISPVLYLLIFFRRRNETKKILVIQTAKIGDLICSTPVFREIKKKYPNVHLTVMVNPVTKELLEYNPYIDEILSITPHECKGLLGKIRLSKLIFKGKYDVGISLNPNIPFATALFWGLVPVRVSVMPNFLGISFKLASKFFNYLEPHISGQMVIETYLKMLKIIGIESRNTTKEIYSSKDCNIKVEQILGQIDKPLIGIAVSSGNKLKELGVDKIVKIINQLLKIFDVYIVLIGSAEEKLISEKVISFAEKKDRIINALGLLSLKELPALIKKLSLFIGVDTGITYMADTLNIPLINIAGPANMKDQRPTGEKVIIIQKNLPCIPCSHAFKSPYYCKINSRECIESVFAEEIISAAKKLFSNLVKNL